MTSVTTTRDGAVAIVTIDRPARLNALDPQCRRELRAALTAAAADQDVRAVVLTGAGTAFCVGHDLTAQDQSDVYAMIRDTYNPLVEAIAEMPKVVVAAINGPAVGAGLGLALQCDVQVMAEDSYLSCAFGKVGLIPDSGVSTALVAAVGRPRALELALSGRRVTAGEASTLGLVNRLAPPNQALPEAVTLAQQIAAGPARSTALTKALFRTAEFASVDRLLDLEARCQAVAASSAGFVEGVTAFVQKRAAVFPAEPVELPDDLREAFRDARRPRFANLGPESLS